jgi:hypothetical protein
MMNKIGEFTEFYAELIASGSTRMLVIMGAAYIDNQLRELIGNFLIDDTKVVEELIGNEKGSDCPLSSFSSRIKAAYF